MHSPFLLIRVSKKVKRSINTTLFFLSFLTDLEKKGCCSIWRYLYAFFSTSYILSFCYLREYMGIKWTWVNIWCILLYSNALENLIQIFLLSFVFININIRLCALIYILIITISSFFNLHFNIFVVSTFPCTNRTV